MEFSIDRLIERSGTPVSLPEVFIRLNSLVQAPDSSVADIVEVAQTDVGLCSRLLQLVNSAYYGFPSTIDSIPRAVTILGTRDLRDLALATTTVDLLSDTLDKQEQIIGLWRHSLYCGVISKQLAEAINEQHTECYFASGLLHDVGRLIMFQALPDQDCKAIQDVPDCNHQVEAERQRLGFSHTDVGARLANKWNLPTNIIEAIAYHHNPEKAVLHPQATMLIYIANQMADTIEQDLDIDVALQRINPAYLDQSRLTPAHIANVASNAIHHFKEMYRLMFADQMAA